MNAYKDYNQTKIYALLGYDGNDPARSPKWFRATTRGFLKEYESSSGRKIPPHVKVNAAEANLCAITFLEQDDTASKCFPPGNGGLVWPQDRDEITHAVTHVFYLCAHYVEMRVGQVRRGEKLERKKPQTKPTGAATTKAQHQKRRRRPPQQFPEQIQETEAWDLEQNDEIIGLSNIPYFDQQPTDPKTWSVLPARFSPSDGLRHLKELCPEPNLSDKTQQMISWLFKDHNSWPSFAEKRLQRLLHEKNVYHSLHTTPRIFQHITLSLIQATEITKIQEHHRRELEIRVKEKMRSLTCDFQQRCFIEWGTRGNIKKTKRFQDMWDIRNEHWKRSGNGKIECSDDPRPYKKLKIEADSTSNNQKSQKKPKGGNCKSWKFKSLSNFAWRTAKKNEQPIYNSIETELPNSHADGYGPSTQSSSDRSSVSSIGYGKPIVRGSSWKVDLGYCSAESKNSSVSTPADISSSIPLATADNQKVAMPAPSTSNESSIPADNFHTDTSDGTDQSTQGGSLSVTALTNESSSQTLSPVPTSLPDSLFLVFQLDDLPDEYDDSTPSSGTTTVPFFEVEKFTLSQFWAFFTSRRTSPESEIQSLIFSVRFGNKRKIDLEHDCGERAWKKLRTVLRMTWEMEQRSRPDEQSFEVWVRAVQVVDSVKHKSRVW